MAVTAQNVFDWLMSIADELTVNGTINPTDTNDYLYRTPAILNLLQASLLKQGDIYNDYEITHHPAEMSYGSFNIFEYTGEATSFIGESASYGYYFETSGEGTIYIEDYASGAWNTLTTITVPSTVTSLTAYKGIVTPTSGATRSRIRFSGTYRYLVKNIGLFKSNFPLASLPDYRPWVSKEMPTDFRSTSQIVKEYEEKYVKDGSYKWEGKKTLYVSWHYEGLIRIQYRPIPDTISLITDTIQLDDVTASTTLVYGLGMELYKNENPELYEHFKNEYYAEKISGTVKQARPEESIQNMYGGFEVG